MDILSNLSLFSGAGGLDLGARIVGGFRTVAYVEKDAYAQGVLMSRIRNGALDDAPIWDDVTTFDGRPWAGLVDVVSGGFPCQDLSIAGRKEGIDGGGRSGLWREYARIVGEVRPRYVLVENVPGLLLRGQLGIVLGDLAALGFDAEWRILSAADVGAPHLRERVWGVAYRQGDAPRPDADGLRPHRAGVDQRGAVQRGAKLRDEQEREPRPLGAEVADAQGQRRGEAGELRQRPAPRPAGGGEVSADRGAPAQGGISNPERDGLRVERERDGQQQGEPGAPEPGRDGAQQPLADAAGAGLEERLDVGAHGQPQQPPAQRGGPLADPEGERERPGLRADQPRGKRRRRLGDGRGEGAPLPDAEGGGQPMRGGAPGQGGQPPCDGQALGDAVGRGRGRKPRRGAGAEPENGYGGASPGDWYDWAAEPNVGRVAHGVAYRVDRLRLAGNGVVPQSSAPAGWARIKEIEGLR